MQSKNIKPSTHLQTIQNYKATLANKDYLDHHKYNLT